MEKDKSISFADSLVDKHSLKTTASLIEYGTHTGIAMAGAMVLFTMLVMVAVVIEHKRTMCITAALGAVLAAGLLAVATVFFVAKGGALYMATETLKEGMVKYSLAGKQLNQSQAEMISGYYRIVDRIQIKGKCCGYGENRYDSYMENFQKQNPRSCVPGFGFQVFPYTCCANPVENNALFPDCVVSQTKHDDHCNATDGTKMITHEFSIAINNKDCKDTLPDFISSLGTVGALFVTHLVFDIIATILSFFLLFELAEKKDLVVPPVRQLKKLGLGTATIKILTANADDVQSTTMKTESAVPGISVTQSEYTAESEMKTGHRR